MNRFLVYLPELQDWVKVLPQLKALGTAETDRAHIVTLVSDAETDAVDAKLKAVRVFYVLIKAEGDIGYNVRDALAATVLTINPESRGGHWRSDYPRTRKAGARTFMTLADADRIAASVEALPHRANK